MSANFGHKWIAKTRKIHSCGWCAKRIEAGSAAEYSSGVFEGDFWAHHVHPECAAARDSLPYPAMKEGWCPGDWARGRADDECSLPPVFSPDYRGKIAGQFTIKIMTPEQKRIAIAQACGWEKQNHETIWWNRELGKYAKVEELPDYFSDLNACHEMEKVLTDEQHIIFRGFLRTITLQAKTGAKIDRKFVSATAAQRAEAFGRTLDLWTE